MMTIKTSTFWALNLYQAQ